MKLIGKKSRNFVLFVFMIGNVFPLLPLTSHAVLVSQDDLFLPPSLISEDFYDTHLLTFDSGTEVIQNYTSGDIGGSLLGVRILPVLNPNPATTSSEGEYTP